MLLKDNCLYVYLFAVYRKTIHFYFVQISSEQIYIYGVVSVTVFFEQFSEG